MEVILKYFRICKGWTKRNRGDNTVTQLCGQLIKRKTPFGSAGGCCNNARLANRAASAGGNGIVSLLNILEM